MTNDPNASEQAVNDSTSSFEQNPDYTRKTFELTEELVEIINEYSRNREESIEESMRNLMSLLVSLQEVGGFMFFYPDDVSYDPDTPNTKTRSISVAVSRDTLNGLNDIAREHDLSLEDVLEIGIRNNKQVEEQKDASETDESETDDSGSGTGSDEMPHPHMI